jgi:hypothetical protein
MVHEPSGVSVRNELAAMVSQGARRISTLRGAVPRCDTTVRWRESPECSQWPTLGGAVAEEVGRQTGPTGNFRATFAFARTIVCWKVKLHFGSHIFKGNFASRLFQ